MKDRGRKNREEERYRESVTRVQMKLTSTFILIETIYAHFSITYFHVLQGREMNLASFDFSSFPPTDHSAAAKLITSNGTRCS